MVFTGSKGRSHGKKKGVRPDDFLSKFGSDAAGDPTTTRAEPISVPKLMQRTQVLKFEFKHCKNIVVNFMWCPPNIVLGIIIFLIYAKR